MKRSLLTALGVMLLTLAVPSAALAHHGRGHHHHHHHKAKARRHHAKFRVVHVGPGTTSTSPSPPSTGTTPPTTTPENAGTVASYANNVLTLTLNDGSTLSGKVTNATRIRCVKPHPAPTAEEVGNRGPGDDDDQGDDRGRGDMNHHGDLKSGDSKGSWQGDGHDGDRGASEPPCDTSALVAGAVVRAAELRIGPGGSEFESVWLVR